jgi:signal transduction histidine kinase
VTERGEAVRPFGRAIWRTSAFRLSALYGVLFAIGLVTLLGLVYARSSDYLTRRVDAILVAQAAALEKVPTPELARRIGEAAALNGARTGVFGLFTASGGRIAGNLAYIPATLKPGGPPIEAGPSPALTTPTRLIARRLASGAVLVVGRDVSQQKEIRGIIASALIWSGVVVILGGLACGAALSLGPLQRLAALQAASAEIAGGDLSRRLPVSKARDELDTLAATINMAVGEVERLMGEVKGASETIAHDLRTPLTRARAQLGRLQTTASASDPKLAAELARVSGELDDVLERFRALMRITELEARQRRAGFVTADLVALAAEAADLYGPLADAEGVAFSWSAAPGAVAEADPKLLFEAMSNLIDNAIKFAGAGHSVRLAVEAGRIVVEDDGPGIPEAEKTAVLTRFYRGEGRRQTPGAGLGLSIAAAIVRLHRFSLRLEDASPGLRAVIEWGA